MTAWKTEKPGEHRFNVGAGEILVVHGGEVSRAHLHVLPTFWRTDGSDMPPDVRAQALAIPLEYMQREALEQSGHVLSDALKAVEIGLAALPRPPVGHVVRFTRPRRPFEARAADFARDLQALTERYGVAVLQSEGIRYGDHVVALVDSAGGAYRFQQDAFDGETQSVIVWVDGGAK